MVVEVVFSLAIYFSDCIWWRGILEVVEEGLQGWWFLFAVGVVFFRLEKIYVKVRIFKRRFEQRYFCILECIISRKSCFKGQRIVVVQEMRISFLEGLTLDIVVALEQFFVIREVLRQGLYSNYIFYVFVSFVVLDILVGFFFERKEQVCFIRVISCRGVVIFRFVFLFCREVLVIVVFFLLNLRYVLVVFFVE